MRLVQFIVLALLIFILSLGRPADAQDGQHDDATAAATIKCKTNFVQRPDLPATPQPHKVVDKKFMTVMGTLALAETMRLTTRHLVIERESAAGAPWAVAVPSHADLIARHTPIYAAEMLVAYEIKRRHDWLPGDNVFRRLWWAYPVAAAAIDFKLGVHTVRLQPPAGCTQQGCP